MNSLQASAIEIIIAELCELFLIYSILIFESKSY
jgi:hypothetical protein